MMHQEFAEKVIREAEKRSCMTFVFSKKGYRKYRNWFFKQGKKDFSWSKWKCIYEFNRFAKAFNITIK